MSQSELAVSAPGKVLFAGGFLVLDRRHTGLVFGLNARIHIHIQARESTTHRGKPQFLVHSPQFRDARWLYEIGSEVLSNGPGVEVHQVTTDSIYTATGNKFVETTLRYALTYISAHSKDVSQSVKITILADNDYYSQTDSVSSAKKDGFTDFGVKLADAHKTGLGSSAALVTALVSALLAFFTDQSKVSSKVTHNLAQAAHCAAQGKVGSGFDVAAAVYGSCLYRRFSPSILEKVGEPGSNGFAKRLQMCVDDLDLDQSWDVEVSSQAVKIPERLLLVMCDVDCGSETPGMVRKVLQWRKEHPADAELLWNAIQQGSEELCAQLAAMSETVNASIRADTELGDTILTIRSMVREMSQKSAVPIEPEVITELLDYCTSLPGVIGGVAPGAGGYDAVALLLKNDVEVYRDLQDRLSSWKSQALGATIGRVRLLGVKQDKEGLRTEDKARYREWADS